MIGIVFGIIGIAMYYLGLYLYFTKRKGYEIGPLGFIIFMVSLIFIVNEYALMV